jgi:hypothetical protein
MHASISEVVPDSDVWTIMLQDLTRGGSFTQMALIRPPTPPPSGSRKPRSRIGTDAGFASLPNLTNPAFTSATTNGAPAALKASEELDLTDSNGNVNGAPSAPNATAGGFDDSAWAAECS